ncbi:hypothetical protein E2P81_ATG06202 [Venturia nashicola]|uniref:Protein N-terminal and lysine N-methyltransferase EFM7 n=1 Tax=Venturia nashicola TaxID=86259 RepID=A0A4Z1NTL2_9PEZI|nr:hypothetical protein E6O75_ATG06345 [Venturia nashicola]TLD27856.1 hypothetical protein E2P81_ATG06202 [Venturia nashicola]
MSDSDEDITTNLFQEPETFFKPAPNPTLATHTLLSGKELKLRLVGHNPLWGHLLWNAGRTISDYLEENASALLSGRNVLELGAGAGLPGIVSAIKGAATVVVTDYPDPDLIQNIAHNINTCDEIMNKSNIIAAGHLWGAPVEHLLALLPDEESRSKKFQTVILADLLFNHSEHAKLIKSVQQTLQHDTNACALVFFTPYRPWLLQKDLAFFDLARDNQLQVKKIMEKVMDKVLFEKDPGVGTHSSILFPALLTSSKDELLRRTVYGYELRWITP